MFSHLALLIVGATIAAADPDFYSAWCPCQEQAVCPNYYGRFFDDVLIFGQIPPCKKFDHVRCCSADNIPEGFDLEQQVQYFPERVQPQEEVVQRAIYHQEALAADVQEDVAEYKQAVEKLKRDIANGIANPNPPCGCYTAGTCPGRYSTKNTGRDIGCYDGFETCCFLDDPWPNYKVTNLTIRAPCSIASTCSQFFGSSPFDISKFGPLEPCYLGQNRCLDYLQDGSEPQVAVVKPPQPAPTYKPRPKPTTQRPTYRPRSTTRPTYAPRPRPTTRPTYAPRPRSTTRPTYAPRPRPTQPATYPTYAPRPTTQRPRPTYRPRTTTTTTRRTTTTTYRTTTRKLPQELVDESGSDSIFDIVANGAYLPPSRDYGNPAERQQNYDLSFQLPF